MALVERLSEWISTIMLLNRQKENEGKCDISHKLIFQQYKYLCNACLVVLCWNQSEFCYWLKQFFFSFFHSALWRILSFQLCTEYQIFMHQYQLFMQYKCMNAMNNEIFYAESVITYLKASCCFPLVTIWECSNTSTPLCHCTLANSNIISVTAPSPSQSSACAGTAALEGWGKQEEFSCLGSICCVLPANPKVAKLIPQLDLIHKLLVLLRSCVIIYSLMPSVPNNVCPLF